MTTSNTPGESTPRCYLDTASAEPLHPVAKEVLLAALDKGYADPRRLHHEGRQARLLLDNAREVVAQCLEVRPDEVTFTGSGTEAVHRGLLGLHRGARQSVSRVVCSSVEHSSVWAAAEWAVSREDSLVTPVPVSRQGAVTPDALEQILCQPGTPATSVVAIQHANHEVGTVQPIEDLLGVMAESTGSTPLFLDACASAGRLKLPTGWAAAAASAHKWGGPAGVGVLLVKRGARWRDHGAVDDRCDPRGLGFENVPGALAAAAALAAVTEEREVLSRRQFELIDLVRSAAAALPDVDVVGDPVARLPHLVTFSCLYVDGESLVTELDRLGYAVASGSACAASTMTPSRVLEAMGALTHGNVRVSVTRETTEAEIRGFVSVLPAVVAELRARVGL